jgi:putative membrane protein
MNASIVETGEQIIRDEAVHRGPSMWRDPLFGLIPAPLIWNFVIVVLVVLIFWWLTRGSNKNTESAMSILKKRYAAGEIDRKTFMQMKEDIAD